MPHAIIKLYSGRSKQEKSRLADAITAAIKATLDCGDDAISVGVEEVAPEDWEEKVYRLDILDKPESIWKQPGYKMPSR